VYTPLVRRLPRSRRSTSSLEVAYRDGEGVLRRVLSTATDLDYMIADLEVTRRQQARGSVSVAFDVEGRREIRELVEALEHVDGVEQVHGGDLPI
jgi:acetolactate synthase regulatory subunit